MATKLDEYFADHHPFDSRDLRDVQAAIRDCVNLYVVAGEKAAKDQGCWLEPSKGWAYSVKDGDTSPDFRPSISTTGMIGAALRRLLGSGAGERAAEGYRDRPYFPPTILKEQQKVKNLVKSSTKALAKLCKTKKSEPHDIENESKIHLENNLYNVEPSKVSKVVESLKGKDFVAYSSTYGPDDPASLGWCWDLSKDDSDHTSLRDAIIRASVSKAEGYLISNASETSAPLITPAQGALGASAFMALRFARLIQSLQSEPWKKDVEKFDGSKFLSSALTTLARFFEATLHRHLSFAEIPDSRFDAAEMIFCLEGMLICEKWQIDDRIFLRVIELLKRAQEANAFWRSETPIVAMDNGHVLLPVSVEAAKSLLAAVSIYDGDKKLHAPIAAACIEMLRRFWRWLVSRKVEITLGSNRLFGWHSEHVNDRKLIQLWETSQVLEFLLSFEHLLRLHIARTSLELSGVSHEWPREDGKGSDTVQKRWAEVKEKFEMRSFGPADMQVYGEIGRDFVDRRIDSGPMTFAPFAHASWSMLLYGPPGTGKSSIAKNLAEAFDCRFISLSVSDFMDSGPGQMEARAKQIFKMLEAQPFSVVIFDEFDPFMYDRDSKRFSELAAEFQLMTNGMLPKLQSLRQSRRVVFVFATNYIDRIDAALRRVGRFDYTYMVPPMDRNARARTIAGLIYAKLEKWCLSSVAGFGDHLRDEEFKGAWKGLKGSIKEKVMERDQFAKASAGFGYGELELAFDRAVTLTDNGNIVVGSGANTTVFCNIKKPPVNVPTDHIELDCRNGTVLRIDTAALNSILDGIAKVLSEDLTPAISLTQYSNRLFPDEKKSDGICRAPDTSKTDAQDRVEQSVIDEFLGLASVYWEVGRKKVVYHEQIEIPDDKQLESLMRRLNAARSKLISENSLAAKKLSPYLAVGTDEDSAGFKACKMAVGAIIRP